MLGRSLGVVGLLNVQLAITPDGGLYVLEAEPARVAHRPVRLEGDRHPARRVGLSALDGRADLRPRPAEGAAAEAMEREGGGAAVRPLPGERPRARPRDARDGRGDGERRGPADRAREGRACSRSRAPRSGAVFLSIRSAEQKSAVPIAATLLGLGFKLFATEGTAGTLSNAGLEVEAVRKLSEAKATSRP